MMLSGTLVMCPVDTVSTYTLDQTIAFKNGHMPANKWDKYPATTNAVERMNKDSKESLRIDLKEALVRVYHIDKDFTVHTAERVQIRYVSELIPRSTSCCQEEMALQ